jgi:hypothetical protein
MAGLNHRRGRLPQGPPQLRVAFLLQPRFTLLAYSSFVDVLRHAADEADQSRQILCTWHVLGDPATPLPASCGVEIRAQVPIESMPLQDLDYVVIVGGLLSSASEIDPAAYAFLRRARREGVGLVALCTGFLHLARADLLDGRRVAIPWMYAAPRGHGRVVIGSRDDFPPGCRSARKVLPSGGALLGMPSSGFQLSCMTIVELKFVTAMILNGYEVDSYGGDFIDEDECTRAGPANRSEIYCHHGRRR